MWTYLKLDDEGDWMPGEDLKFPPFRTFYLAFDSLRWRIVLGFRERGGNLSMVDPHVDDDCNTIAWAPLGETSNPDMDQIHAASPWHEAAYKESEFVTLLR